jgi:hypothetical protein
MFTKTNIPETTTCLAANVDFGDTMFDQEIGIIKDRTNKIQALISGNRCGHVPSEPRFFNRPDYHKPRPAILEEAISKLKDVYLYPKSFFQKLATFLPNDRQKRSERREAHVSVAQVLLHYLELSSLQVGLYDESSQFIALDIRYIANKAGIGLLRARRAIADFIKAGYINATRRCDKKDNGRFAGLPSIREVSVQFFIDLGMDMTRFMFAREWKRKKQAKAQAKATHKKLSGMLKAATALAGVKHPTARKKQETLNQANTDERKAQIAQALALHQADPSCSASDYLRRLQKQQE